MQRAPEAWLVDPEDPRAPPQEVWDAMTPEERAGVLDALPSEFPISESSPPEGDFHFRPKVAVRDALGGHFQRLGRRVYLASELPVYYPNEPMFAPDLIAVTEVDTKERPHWSVSAEGRGVDLAFEILWHGRRKKDLVENVARFAALGIPEYFVFDRLRCRIHGYRLPSGATRYQPIVPQAGRLAISVLGIEVGLEGDRLRFFHAFAPIPETHEILARMGSMVDDLERRAEDADRRAEEAERRAEEASERAVDTATRLAEALAEIERLKRERG